MLDAFKLEKDKLLYLTLCCSSLTFALYLYAKLLNTHDTVRTAKNVNRILAVRGFRGDLELEVIWKCSTRLNLYNISVQPQAKWQKVGKNSDWYIFSAYTDNRLGSPLIRILAISKGDYQKKVFCRVWHNATDSFVTEVQKQELWLPAWNRAKPGEFYHPFLLTCPSRGKPIAVSVTQHPCSIPSNSILFADVGRGPMEDFAVCLKPLSFDQDISVKLLEWLELHYLLGADTVFLYVSKAHPQTMKVLEYYEKLGEMKTEKFQMPGKGDSLWQKRRHEMIAYNDCFYRHVHTHKYVINVDLDEVIVPVIHDTWLEMLNAASTRNPRLKNSASMGVRNVYFFGSFGESRDNSVPEYMYMLNHVYRSANLTPPGFAQKSIFSTNYTLVVTNHFALRTLRPHHYALADVGEDLARLHHYRKDCPPLMEKDCIDNYMRYKKLDTSLWRYKDELVQRVHTNALKIGIAGMPKSKESITDKISLLYI